MPADSADITETQIQLDNTELTEQLTEEIDPLEELLKENNEDSNSQESDSSESINNAKTFTLEFMTPAEKLQISEIKDDETVAIVTTNKGKFVLRFFPEAAPKTVENFTTLAKKGYYDGIIFHRIIDGFMIQGGDPTGTGMGGESAWGGKFDDEFSADAKNNIGSISMANAGPGTNGSQFFINTANNNFLDNKHSVFGEVIWGMNTINDISTVKTGASDKPVEDVVIEGIELTSYADFLKK